MEEQDIITNDNIKEKDNQLRILQKTNNNLESKLREARAMVDNKQELIKTLSEREERRESEMKKMEERTSSILSLNQVEKVNPAQALADERLL